MRTRPAVLFTVIVVEFCVICFLLYNQNATKETVSQNEGGMVSLDTLNTIQQSDSIEQSAILTHYIRTSVVNFQELSASFGGQCRNRGSFGGAVPPSYLQVDVTIKGTNLLVPQYMLDGKDYASSPGCFVSRPEGHTMSNFIPYSRTDSILPFLVNLRTNGVRDNAFEYSVIIKDNKGTQVAKYPKGQETMKGKIPFISSSVVINDTIQLKKSA
jgi:hypothetical protein